MNRFIEKHSFQNLKMEFNKRIYRNNQIHERFFHDVFYLK